MKIVKVKDKRRHGVSAVTEVGTIKPSIIDGTFLLEDHQAKILVEGDSSFIYAEDFLEEAVESLKKTEDVKPKAEEPQFFDLDADELEELEQLKALQETKLQSTTVTEKSDINSLSIKEQIEEVAEEAFQEPAVEEDESIETKEYRAILSSKTKNELIELAKQFPGGEWRALTKEPLIEYLIGKTK